MHQGQQVPFLLDSDSLRVEQSADLIFKELFVTVLRLGVVYYLKLIILLLILVSSLR